jgi:pimeloyl-ACP methyl ester carboxylesterase
MQTPRLQSVQWLSPQGLHSLGYREWGAPDNPHVLIAVHGLTRTGADFEYLAQALSHKVRVIAPDMPGRGLSEWLPNGAMYVIPYYLSACVALVARTNSTTLDWLGTSMGGLIGMAYASVPHNPIRKLILNDVGPQLNLDALKRIGDYVSKQVMFDTKEQACEYIKQITLPFGPHTSEQWKLLCGSVLVQKENKWTTHYDPAIADSFQDLSEVTTKSHEQTLWAAYDAITAQTLLVRGELSDLLSPDTAQQMTQRGPKAKLVEVRGVGHAPTFMQNEQIALIEQFLF